MSTREEKYEPREKNQRREDEDEKGKVNYDLKKKITREEQPKKTRKKKKTKL